MDVAISLPIQDALPALKAALQARTEAVLVAPPGAGKTTVVPLRLLDEPWVRRAASCWFWSRAGWRLGRRRRAWLR